jgi:hypothetical protein
MAGKLSSSIIEFAGANTPGWVSNLAVTYATSTLTITDAQGAALSATNSGWVTVPSTTAGQYKCMEVTLATHLFVDAGGSSDIIAEEFGVTTGVAWGNARPFFLSACMEDADADVSFAISPNPCATVVPATANIGYHGNPGATPSDNNFFFLNSASSVTTAYDGNPCVCIGAINMTMDASDDWTLTALATDPRSGIGPDCILGHLSQLWTLPLAQMGAATGTFFKANGGTAPIFTTNTYKYSINAVGGVRVHIFLNGDGGTPGAGAVTSLIALPYAEAAGLEQVAGTAHLNDVANGQHSAHILLASSVTHFQLKEEASTLAQNGDFQVGARQVATTFEYDAF